MNIKNPKIKFFKVHLTPIKGGRKVILRDIFQNIFLELNQDYDKNSVQLIDDNSLIKEFFQYFFKKIDSKFNADNRRNKAFYATPEIIDGKKTTPIKLNQNEYTVQGVIRGGEFNTGKTLADITNPEYETSKLKNSEIILDSFYFCIYFPTNKDTAILVLQSYTKDEISDVFIPFISRLFKSKGLTNNANLEKFMPQIMQEEFKEGSIIEKFIFKNKMLISEMDEGVSNSKEFEVQIEIKSLEKDINLSKFKKWKQKLSDAVFNTNQSNSRKLSTFNEQIGYLKPNDGVSKPTPFELNSDKLSVNATIYLQKYIPLNIDGTPKWDKLEEFVKEILFKDVVPEVYPEDYIK